jgi:hypothetical protein
VAGGNPHVARYILIYFAFGIGSATLVVMQTLILWIFCSIEVSITIRRIVHPPLPLKCMSGGARVESRTLLPGFAWLFEMHVLMQVQLQASRKLHASMAHAM